MRQTEKLIELIEEEIDHDMVDCEMVDGGRSRLDGIILGGDFNSSIDDPPLQMLISHNFTSSYHV